MTLPTPRIWHAPPGSRIVLKGDRTTRIVSHIKGRHAVMDDGLIVSVCYPVDPKCMQFGDGAGWRPLINTNRE